MLKLVLKLVKHIGSWARTAQGWLFLLMSGLPAATTAVSGFYEGLPWAHTIALTMLALAGGAVLVVCLISIWEKMGGRKQAALLALGKVWEDGTDFRNEAATRRVLTIKDFEKIRDINAEILKHVGVVSKPSLSKFRKIGTFEIADHPREVQEDVRGDKTLLILSERLKRVFDFIEKHSGTD